MSLTLAAEAPPLTIHDDGSIRVAGTRFLLDVLIASHVNWGWSAEKIAAEYDTLQLADVYAVLAYYYRHRAEVEAYLARRDAEAADLRRQIEARQGPQPQREVWLAKLKAKRGE